MVAREVRDIMSGGVGIKRPRAVRFRNAKEARGIVGGPVSYALGVDGTGLVTFKFDIAPVVQW